MTVLTEEAEISG